MTRKVKKNGSVTEETEYVRNVDVRERFIKQKGGKNYQKGYKAFLSLGERDEKWKKLRDIPIPTEYSWIFKHFMQIWQGCEYDMMGNAIITFKTINDYVECMKVPLSVADKKCLLKIKAWAMNTIAEMKETD